MRQTANDIIFSMQTMDALKVKCTSVDIIFGIQCLDMVSVRNAIDIYKEMVANHDREALDPYKRFARKMYMKENADQVVAKYGFAKYYWMSENAFSELKNVFHGMARFTDWRNDDAVESVTAAMYAMDPLMARAYIGAMKAIGPDGELGHLPPAKLVGEIYDKVKIRFVAYGGKIA